MMARIREVLEEEEGRGSWVRRKQVGGKEERSLMGSKRTRSFCTRVQQPFRRPSHTANYFQPKARNIRAGLG